MQRLHPLRLGEAIDLDVDVRLEAHGAAAPVVWIGLGGGRALVAGERRWALHAAAGRHGHTRAGRIALHAIDRMEGRMQRKTLPVDFHGHRIDQERHVIVDDFDHRVAAIPTVLLKARVVDPHARLAGHELLAELPVRHRRAVEIGDAARDHVLGVGQLVVMPHEWLEQHGDIGRTSACEGHYIRHVLADLVFELGRHGASPENGPPHATPRAHGWQWGQPGLQPPRQVLPIRSIWPGWMLPASAGRSRTIPSRYRGKPRRRNPPGSVSNAASANWCRRTSAYRLSRDLHTQIGQHLPPLIGSRAKLTAHRGQQCVGVVELPVHTEVQ